MNSLLKTSYPVRTRGRWSKNLKMFADVINGSLLTALQSRRRVEWCGRGRRRNDFFRRGEQNQWVRKCHAPKRLREFLTTCAGK